MFGQEILAILETLLKWKDKLLGYHIHMITDHKALGLFQMQLCLLGRQTRWMEYLMKFNFDIRYIKEELNKVADVLSHYYKHDYWMKVPEMQDYINTNVRLDPDHNDLPKECLFKVEEKVIESRVENANTKKTQVEV
jgi:conjugal transfer/entry exclusion protein